MATIYRRNRGLSPMQHDDAHRPEDLDSAGARRWWGWGQRRRSALTALGDASPLSVRNPIINGVVGSNNAVNSSGSGRRFMSHRVYQIMWLAVLVYAFLGLPVLGRVLNFLRYSHRFTGTSVLKGLVAGLFQDVAVFFQASTLICIVKLLLHESSLLSLSGGAGSSAASRSLSERSNSWLRSDSGSSSFDGGYAHSSSRQMRHPVYMPVLSNEYDSSNDSDSSTVDSFGRHTTLLASSGVTGPTASYLSSIAPRGTWLYMKVRSALQNCLVAVLIKAVVVAATIASVVDFCLQVTMHPRLNRAFVEIFFNYASQFTASLLDEEVLTRTVVCSWAVYLALIGALTYGFYANKLPLLPSFFFLPGTFFSCYSCQGHFHQGKRKDSMMSSTAASSALPLPSSASNAAPATGLRAFIASLFPSHWLAAKPPQPPITRARRRSGQNHSLYHHHANQQPSSLFAHLFGCSSSTPTSSSAAFSVSSKPSPSMVVLRCFVTSVVMTLIALTASLMVDGKGVDMKLMSNAMFSLQTEGFFVRSTTIGREEINCTLASQELLATLDKNEIYETEGLGNDDRCALLWRKTVGYTGESFFEIKLKNVTTIVVEAAADSTARTDASLADSSREAPSLTPAVADAVNNETTTSVDATTETPTTAAATTPTAPPKTVSKVALPNIIVISMESWRALDVGVLGGAERKAKFGKSATPEFDELTKSGVLYKKHYTQCVQTTRTLLTQLFGMLPSCTETTALKRYGTSLNVRGLPQYLKKRGYFNMFWSAVNLSWEYWDKFLVQNGFDKLVDDRKIRKMLHEVRDYKNRDDDHFSWGMHDHLSFEMLLHAIESSHNATRQHALDKEKNSSATTAAVSTSELEAATGLPVSTSAAGAAASVAPEANSTETKTTRPSLLRNRSEKSKKTEDAEAKKKKRTESLSAIKSLPGWEGLQEPYFIDMYTISSHNPWALPNDYDMPDLSSLYTPYTKKYIDSMYFSDEMLGKFIREMRAKGLMKNTVVLIQGDHGYGRMEHNNPSIADSGIYDEGSHVPFLILADDFLSEQEKGMQVDQLTMQSDLMATVADIVGVSPDEPLYQHGYGHSMKRRRPAPAVAEDLALQPELAEEPTAEQLASLSSPAVLQERRVVMCNPFNGMTKGIRTEARKFAFFPDGAFKVFEPASDPGEKNPMRAGFDVEKMDFETKTMFDFATEHVDLNQFLFENNKFMAPAPAKTHGLPPSRHHQQPHIKRVPIQVEQEQYLAATSSFAPEALKQSSGDSEPHLASAVSTGDKASETPVAPSPPPSPV